MKMTENSSVATQIMKDSKRYAARLHKNAFRCYNQIKGMRKEMSKEYQRKTGGKLWKLRVF